MRLRYRRAAYQCVDANDAAAAAATAVDPFYLKNTKTKRKKKLQVFSVSLESFFSALSESSYMRLHSHAYASFYIYPIHIQIYIYIDTIYQAIRMFSICACVSVYGLLSPPLTTFRCSGSLCVRAA